METFVISQSHDDILWLTGVSYNIIIVNINYINFIINSLLTPKLYIFI